MNMKIVWLGFVSVLLLSTVFGTIWSSGSVKTASHTTWRVGPEGPPEYDFAKIQDAIDAASDRDTILVFAGTYEESLVIHKPLTLIGFNGSQETTIDAQHTGEYQVITIKSCNVRVEGFTIEHTALMESETEIPAGIRLESDPKSGLMYGIEIHKNHIECVDVGIDSGLKHTVDLHDSAITENTFVQLRDEGIYVSDGTKLSVTNNIIEEVGGPAIRACSLDHANITGNIVTNCTEGGLCLEKGNGNDIIGNTFTEIQNWCVEVAGSENNISNNKVAGSNGISIDGNHSNIYKNQVTEGENYGIYVRGVNNDVDSNIITDGWDYGISLLELSNNIINNRIRNVTTGIYNPGYISGNEIEDSFVGIHIRVRSESNVTIFNNFFRGCEEGVRIEGNLSSIASNTFMSCSYGVYNLETSSGNVIYHNMFLNSSAADDNEASWNSWDNGTMGGNYWFDYECEDCDCNGLGDTPQPICNRYGNETTNKDNYPLIVPPRPIPVFWKEKKQGEIRSYCTVDSSMTVSRFHLDEKTKIIDFNVTGHGYCNLTIPEELLHGAFKVLVDNYTVPSIITWNTNNKHTYVYFTCESSTLHSVEVIAQFKLKGDIDGDGEIDIADFLKMAKEFGKKLLSP